MGTQVATTDGARGVMSVNLANVDYGRAKSSVDKYISSVGGSSGGEKSGFPGEQIYFKKGEWFIGFGDKKRPVKAGARLVMNIPNMMAAWCKWNDVEGRTNKKGAQLRLPKYTKMTFPAAGDDPIERNTLGDDDRDQWEPNDDGSPQDPWKPILVFPVRSVKHDGTGAAIINHVHLDTVSKVIPGFNLFRDILDDLKLHEGELPIVEIGTKKTSMDKQSTKTVRGKEVTKSSKVTWDVPTFEVVGWVDAIAEDNPSEGGMKVTADEPADLGKVEAKSRTAGSKKNGNGQKLLAAPVKGKAKAAPKSRKQVVAVEDDDNPI